MGQDTREVWSKRVERWKDSGLTAKEFATETGINVNSLTHWKWKLSAQARPRRPAAAEPCFIEISSSPAAAAGVAAASQVDPLELILPDGLRVRVPVHFDETALRRVIVVLAGR